MNLILQAIKSMFRRLATKVDRNTEQITEHTASINGLQNGVETAQTAADSALSKAETAQTAVDELKIYKINATVADNIATVTNLSTLIDGTLYFIVTSGTTTSTNTALIKCGGETHGCYVGINAYNTNTELLANANMVFGTYKRPIIALFSNKQFHILNRTVFDKPVPCKTNIRYTQFDNRMFFYGTHLQSDTPERYVYMRVKSSTAGSTKLFDIQVDDNGTITAVEVTE